MSELTVTTIKKLKVAELKAELGKRGLSIKGKKDELAKRLMDAIEEDSTPENDEPHDGEPTESVESLTQEDDSVVSSSQSLEEDDQEEHNDNVVESQTSEETETLPSETAKAEQENKAPANDDWVMVETPAVDEAAAVQDAAIVQDSNIEQANAKEDDKAANETTEPAASDVPMDDDAKGKNEVTSPDVTKVTSPDVTIKDESAKDVSDKQGKNDGIESTEKTGDGAENAAPAAEEKIEDALVEVEHEEGDDMAEVQIADGHVGLDSYTGDLHFILGENGLSGHNLVKNGFSYMWAGARANKGAKGGKIGYEVKIKSFQTVDLPEGEAPVHAVRIGWSLENSSLQLGESSYSYGYESTGKVCASATMEDYGGVFGEGDVIGTYLDLESEPKSLKYTKNGVDLGVAMSLTVNLEEKPLFPHVFLRNVEVELNFGANEDPWFEVLDGYSLIQNAGAENIAEKSSDPPESASECEVLLMVGLPNAGKSTWVKKYVDSHPERHYNVISVNQVLERCKMGGKSRKKSDEGHEKLMHSVIQVLTKLYELCPKRKRNFIFDQNNIYEIAQQKKMESFKGYKRKAVVVVPTHDNLRRRTSDAKRKGDNIHDVPFGDLCDMKCEFCVPEVGDHFDEIVYPELDEKNAHKTVRDYQSDGARAKRTGRDEYYPRKRQRYDDRSYGRRDGYGGGQDRRDDWKSSGSGYGGYGGGYKGRSNYGSGGYNKGNRNQYQDPYRRNSGGSSAGYRQQSYGGSGGGGGYRGGSYGSSSYGSSNYGSGGYGNYGSYGSSHGYGSGSYSSSGSSYNYGSYSQPSSNRGGTSTGHWGQYGSSYTTPTSQNQWSSGSGNWSGYNYNSYSGSGSSYGGSGYSY